MSYISPRALRITTLLCGAFMERLRREREWKAMIAEDSKQHLEQRKHDVTLANALMVQGAECKAAQNYHVAEANFLRALFHYRRARSDLWIEEAMREAAECRRMQRQFIPVHAIGDAVAGECGR